MGEWTHKIDKDTGVCGKCGVPAIIRQKHPVCPIAWRAGHGQRKIRKPVPEGERRTRERVEHNLEAMGGVVWCSCGSGAIPLESGLYTCATQENAAQRSVELNRERRAREARAAARYAKMMEIPEGTETDADLGLTATVATREYRTLSGRRKGGEPAPADGTPEGETDEGLAAASSVEAASGDSPEERDNGLVPGHVGGAAMERGVPGGEVAPRSTGNVAVRDLRSKAARADPPGVRR